MKEGFRFIDTDTHVGPNVETLEQHAGPVLRRRWDELRPYYQQVTEGHHLSIDPIPFKRDLNTGSEPRRPAPAVPGRTSRFARRSR